MSTYRIPKKLPVVMHNGAPPPIRRGVVVAYTTAKRPDGVRGVCIAVFDTTRRCISRLCSNTGAAAPFHDPVTVSELGVNWEVEFQCCSGPQTELPHGNDDIWVTRIDKICYMHPATVHGHLAPLAAASIESLWPAHLEGGKPRPSIINGSNVRSLAVLRGRIEKFDVDSGLVNLLLDDNEEGSVPLEEVKTVSAA